MTTPWGHFSSRNSIFGFLILIELEIINSWRAWQVEVDFDFILFIIIHLLGIVRYIPIWNWFTASGQTWSSTGRLDFWRFVLDSESLKSKNLSHKKGPSSYYQSIAIIWIHQFLKMFGPWTICCSGTVVKDRFTMIFD